MEQTAIQKVLRNEITWVIMTGAFLWGVVTTVVLPLQKLQIQLAQVQLDLTTQNKKYDTLNTAVNALGNRTSVVESELNNIFKK